MDPCFDAESPHKDHLNVLLTEFEACASTFEKAHENLVQILAVGAAASAGLVGYIASKPLTLTSEAAWTLPLILSFFYGIVIYVMHLRLAAYWNARILETRINIMLPEISVIRSVPEYPSARFFSSRRGNGKIHGLYILLGFIAMFFLAALVYICFRLIYEINHFSGTLFLILNLLIMSVELLAIASLNVDMPKMYYKLMEQVNILKRMPTKDEFKKVLDELLGVERNTLIFAVLPRPWDVTAKGLYFWYGFAFAYIIFGTHPNNLPVLSALFVPGNIYWSNVDQVPLWAILVFGLIFFILEELVLQQAKLLWDDVRDRDRDRHLPLNAERAVAKGIINRISAIYNLIVRLFIAFTLGYLLGGWSIVVVFALILLHQALYVLGTKPRVERHPLQSLFLLSLNTSWRFVAGVVIVAGVSPLSTLVMSLLIAINYFHSLSNSSLLWRIETDHLNQIGHSAFAKPQGPFFVTYGRRLQHYALMSMLLIGVPIYLFSIKHPVLQWIDRNTLSPGVLPILTIISLGLVSALIYFILSLAFYLISRSISALRKIRRFDSYVKELSEKSIGTVLAVRNAVSLLGNLLLLGGLISLIVNILSANIVSSIWSYFIHNLGFMLNYEAMDYLDYTMARLKEQLSVFKILLPIYLFTADSKLPLPSVLVVLLDYNKALDAKKKLESYMASSAK